MCSLASALKGSEEQNMPKSDVEVWLERETPRIRKALESASRHFDGNDDLTVNTLEAVYGQESSFGCGYEWLGT